MQRQQSEFLKSVILIQNGKNKLVYPQTLVIAFINMWTRSGKTVQNSSLNQSAFKSWGPQIFCGAYLIVGPSLLLMYVSKIIKVFCVSLQCYFSNRERISRSYSSCLLIEFISKMYCCLKKKNTTREGMMSPCFSQTVELLI